MAKAGGGVRGTIRVRGLDELNEALLGFEPALAKKVLRKAMRDAARPVLEDAKRNAPVLTGALRRSLKIRAIKRTRKHRVGVVVSTAKGFFKGDEFYAAFHEFGTSHQPAKPYIRPAFDANAAKSVQIAAASIKQGIDDLARGFKKLSKFDVNAPLPQADLDVEQ